MFIIARASSIKRMFLSRKRKVSLGRIEQTTPIVNQVIGKFPLKKSLEQKITVSLGMVNFSTNIPNFFLVKAKVSMVDRFHARMSNIFRDSRIFSTTQFRNGDFFPDEIEAP